MLFVHGPGGIGKTTLLELRTRARAADRAVVLLNGREIDPSPEGFQTAVSVALGERTAPGPDARLPTGAVLLVDGYEQLSPINGWLRHDLLPSLSADNVVVLAGRDAPDASWRTDAGWRQVVAIHRLDHFDEADSGELLARAGVEPAVRPHLVRLGRGHPLAMALLGEVVEPLYRATLWLDRHRLAEIGADVAGMPYETDDRGWAMSKAAFAASLVDPELARAYLSLASLLVSADELFADRALAARVLQLGAGAPKYPLPGPSRSELLSAID